MTRHGRLYELLTLGHLIVGSGGSASRSIPTPTASDAIKERPWQSSQHTPGSLHSVTLVDFIEMELGLVGESTNPPSDDGSE
jgi:hypothetical protein